MYVFSFPFLSRFFTLHDLFHLSIYNTRPLQSSGVKLERSFLLFTVSGREWVQSCERSPPCAPLTPELTFPVSSGPCCKLSRIITSRSFFLITLFHASRPINELFLFQVRQNSSSPTNMSFGDQMTNPKQLSVKFVQVRRMTEP